MRVLAIDPSLNSLGYCIFEDGLLYDFGAVQVSKGLEQHIKIYNISNILQNIIDTENIDKIVLEGMSFGSISTSVRPLAGVYYQILILAYINNLEWEEIAPTSVKKFATGSGKAKKPDMWKALPDKIKDKIEVQYKTIASGKHDICDAYHIGMLFYKNS
jgi:crossover junction endodeoxyribonuclease RuvC